MSPLRPSLPLLRPITLSLASTSALPLHSRSYAVSSNPRDRDTPTDTRSEAIRKNLYPVLTVEFEAPSAGTSGSATSSKGKDKGKGKKISGSEADVAVPSAAEKDSVPAIAPTTLASTSRTNPSTPTGTYHPSLPARLSRALTGSQSPSPSDVGSRVKETHETITMALATHSRVEREQRERNLRRKWESMQRACEALRVISANAATAGAGSSAADGGEAEQESAPGKKIGLKNLYDLSTYRPLLSKPSSSPLPAFLTSPTSPTTASSGETATANEPKKLSQAEKKFYAARIEGLFPRELRVPVEGWVEGSGKEGETGGRGWDYGWRRVGA